MMISQMNRCSWRRWRPIEVEAIENFFVAWFTEALLDPTLRASLWVDERLKVIAFSGTAIESYLELWRNERTLLSALKLADFVRSNLPRKKEAFPRRWDNVWGNERVNRAAISAVREFVISRDTHDFLEDCFFQADLPNEQETLSLAIELVQIMREQQE